MFDVRRALKRGIGGVGTPPIVAPGSVSNPAAMGGGGMMPPAQPPAPMARKGFLGAAGGRGHNPNLASIGGMIGGGLLDLGAGGRNLDNLGQMTDLYHGQVQHVQDQQAAQLSAEKQAERDRMFEWVVSQLPPEQQALARANPEPAMRALTEHVMKGPEQFTLSEGQKRFEGGKMVAQNEAAPEEFTLSPGAVRGDSTGKVIMENAKGPEQMSPGEAARLRLQREEFEWRKKNPRNGITIGPDGKVQIGGPAGGASRYDQASDARQIEDMRGRTEDLNPVLNTLYAARAELLGPDGKSGTEDDYRTGPWKGLELGIRKAIPGGSEEQRRGENMDALQKEFGIEKLSGIGGNDTERELMVAMQTGPGLTTGFDSNMDRINRQIAVFEFIGESRRNFASRWKADVGSLSAVAREGPYSGMTFDEALSAFQRESAKERGLLGAAPSGVGPGRVQSQLGDYSDEELQAIISGAQ